MKYVINFILIILCAVNFASAQLIPWYLTGNSIASGDFLGTTNSQDLVFKVNSSEKMRVLTGGTVGIGTTAPSYKLDVKDAGTCSIRSMCNGTGGGSSNLILTRGGSSNNCLVNYKNYNQSTTTTTDLWQTGCRGNDNYSIYNEGLAAINFIVAASTGNVGIGDFSAPYSQLSQYLNSAGSLYHQFTNSNTGNTATTDGFKIGLTYSGSYSNAEVISQQNGADLNFYTNSGSGATGRLAIKSSGRVGVGDFGFAYSSAKFQCYNSNEENAIYGSNTNSSPSTSWISGVKGSATGAATNNFGGWFNATGSGTINVGVDGFADGTTSTATNYGGYFYGQYSSVKNVGSSSVANKTSSGINMAGEFIAANGANNYGIYSTSTSSCTGSTSTGSCTSAAGYFAGDVFTTNDYWKASDNMLKTNVTDIIDAKPLLQQLQPKSYLYDTAQFSQMNLPDGIHYGFLAQDIEMIFPQFVREMVQPEEKDSLGIIIHPSVNFKAITYDGFLPLLIKGYQQQQHQIDSLIAALNAQPIKQMNNQSNSLQQKPAAIEVELSNQNKIILDQNDPNPFADNTTINFFIPDNATKVQMMFYDNSGTILKTVDIKEKGQGSIMVYGSNLTSGIYSYTLLADGKVIETKKMMKVK